MKLLKFGVIALLTLPTIALASPKLSCGDWVETEYNHRKTCKYAGSSLNDAYMVYFKDSTLIPKKYKQLPSSNVNTTVNSKDQSIEFSVTWKGKNQVEVAACVAGSDECDSGTFTRKGSYIEIVSEEV